MSYRNALAFVCSVASLGLGVGCKRSSTSNSLERPGAGAVTPPVTQEEVLARLDPDMCMLNMWHGILIGEGAIKYPDRGTTSQGQYGTGSNWTGSNWTSSNWTGAYSSKPKTKLSAEQVVQSIKAIEADTQKLVDAANAAAIGQDLSRVVDFVGFSSYDCQTSDDKHPYHCVKRFDKNSASSDGSVYGTGISPNGVYGSNYSSDGSVYGTGISPNGVYGNNYSSDGSVYGTGINSNSSYGNNYRSYGNNYRSYGSSPTNGNGGTYGYSYKGDLNYADAYKSGACNRVPSLKVSCTVGGKTSTDYGIPASVGCPWENSNPNSQQTQTAAVGQPLDSDIPLPPGQFSDLDQ